MDKFNEKNYLIDDSAPSEPTESLTEKPGERQDASSSAEPPKFETNFASLSLHQNDRLRLLDFSPEVKPLLEKTIKSAWSRGIQNQRVYAGTHEFKFYGNPWWSTGNDQVSAFRLMRRIFEALWNVGWVMYISTDISRKQMDKDTLIFRHQRPHPQPCDWISIAFAKYDRIWIVDAPSNFRDAMIEDLKAYVQDSRPHGSASHTWEIKIRGWPWSANGEETMRARAIVLKMVAVLERFGFTVYASIDQRATNAEKVTETDTWHCRRPQDWMPGAPVYHN